jgi:N-methylhydantoinase A
MSNSANPGQEGLILGVDVGGTFTDFVLWDPAQQALRTHKVLSTPTEQGNSLLTGLHTLGIGTADIIYGSTIATNALLERRGARAALLTTGGFRDILELARQNRPHLYRLLQPPGDPLIPREHRWEVPERLDAEGNVIVPLDGELLGEVAEQLDAAGIESLAVVFLFSFLNSVHERHARDILRARLPGLPITLSSELLPEHREYERTATTVINAYVRPRVERFLRDLTVRLGQGRSLWVMQSNGGIIGAKQAADEAARLVLSGPAGGVVGAFRLMQQVEDTNAPDLITFDMGGTSTDVALCPGVIPTSTESEIAGLPLRLPVIDIHTVGAGGGSMARVDQGGALQVGPMSAGADPGPACYGRGGHEPTVTDANLVLGRLDPARFLGGKMPLDSAAARRAVATIARTLGLSLEATALGILQVANAAMERALRHVSVERGHDPRAFTLFPFGGAGALHACALARSLSISHILVPPHASVMSALGMLLAPLARDFSQSMLERLEQIPAPALAGRLSDLKEVARQQLGEELATTAIWSVGVDCRYAGQSYELTIPLSLPVSPQSITDLETGFHAAHKQQYGSQHLGPIETVTLRLRATAPAALDNVEWLPAKLATPHQARQSGSVPVWFDSSGPLDTATFERVTLSTGARISGPALVYQPDTTVLIEPGWEGAVDPYFNLHLTRETVSLNLPN